MMDQETGRPSLLCMRCQSRHPGRTGPGVRKTQGGRSHLGRRGVHLGKGRGDSELPTKGSAERLEYGDHMSSGL